LDQYQAKYTLGNASTAAYATLASDEIITQLNGALTTGATSVTIDSTTGMTVGDYIGIVLTTKDIHWTTIATIPTSTTLTLTLGVTSAAADNNVVYTFTNRLYKPLRILSARSVNGIDSGATSSRTEVQMNSIAYQTYFDMPTKTINGSRPIQYHYKPNNTDGSLWVWPRPNDCSYRIEFTFERILEDLDSASDDFDLPVEWEAPLVFQLATWMGSDFGKDQKVIQTIGPMAQSMLEALKDWDSEVDSISISPNLDY
jgi:hypothetical protein